MAGNLKAIGYVRVSTEDQAAFGVGLAVQSQKIRTWCALHDATLAREIYADKGMSGKDLEHRPAAQEALQAACDERAVLVVYSLSRLSRSLSDTLKIAERLDVAGAQLASLSEHIDTTAAAGRMIFRILATLAEFERELIGERTKAALAHKRANGEVYGEVPYGCERHGDRLVPSRHAEWVIEQMHKDRAGGASFREIAASMTRLGVSPPKRGGKWHGRTVARILARTSPLGA